MFAGDINYYEELHRSDSIHRDEDHFSDYESCNDDSDAESNETDNDENQSPENAERVNSEN